jgi:hypothetical protein
MHPSADGDLFAAAPDFDEPDRENPQPPPSASRSHARDAWRAANSAARGDAGIATPR